MNETIDTNIYRGTILVDFVMDISMKLMDHSHDS